MSETGRALATVAEIAELVPIEGADRIVLARFVDRAWEVVVGKDDHVVGLRGIYFEPDSFLPEEPCYEDLRQRCFKTLKDGTTGFRVRTIKLRGVYSQGFFLAADKLSDDVKQAILYHPLHHDLTEQFKVQKFPEEEEQNTGRHSRFPSFIPKTEETRIENCVAQFKAWAAEGRPFDWTEKLNGTSFTAFLDINGEFGYCSRNQQLVIRDDPAIGHFSKIVNELGIESRLRAWGPGIAIQGEIVGPKVQNNPYQRSELELYLFTVWSITEQKRLELVPAAEKLGLKTVPILDFYKPLPATMAELRSLAEGSSQLFAKAEREGLVLRASDDPSISAKVISRRFLSKLK